VPYAAQEEAGMLLRQEKASGWSPLPRLSEDHQALSHFVQGKIN
jgi:hypothetical protein